MKVALFLIALTLMGANAQVLSGFNIALLPAAFNQVRDKYLPYSICQATKQTLPDFGFMGYTFSNGKFMSFNLDMTQSAITLNDGWMTVDSKGMSFVLEAQAAQSIGEDQLLGAQPVTITTDTAAFSFGAIPFNQDGHVQWKIGNITTEIGNIQVNAQNGFLSKLNTRLMNNPQVKAKINEEFTNFFSTQFLTSMNALGMMDPIIQMLYGTDLSIDRGLVADPVISTMGATSMFNGTIFVNHQTEAAIPYAPMELPLLDGTATQEFQTFIADYVMNSALANSWKNNLLSWTIPRDFEGYGVPIKSMTTDDFVQYFPEIVNKYGAGSKIQAKCSDIEGTMPYIKTTDSGLEGFEQPSCVMEVYDSASSAFIEFLSFTSDFNWKGSVGLSSHNMISLTAESGTASNVVIHKSAMDDVTVDSLTTFVNGWMVNMLPMMRSFELPIGDFIHLVNPVVSYHMGYVQIVSNAQFMTMSC